MGNCRNGATAGGATAGGATAGDATATGAIAEGRERRDCPKGATPKTAPSCLKPQAAVVPFGSRAVRLSRLGAVLRPRRSVGAPLAVATSAVAPSSRTHGVWKFALSVLISPHVQSHTRP